MRALIQRLVLLTVFSLSTHQAFAGCDDELSFSLHQQVSADRPEAKKDEDKDRVRIMPAGSVTRDYEIRGDEVFEIYRKPIEEAGENRGPALVSRWEGLPGNVALLFEANGQTYVAWVRAFSGLPEIVIAKVDDPMQPVFHFQLSTTDERLLSGHLSLASGENDLLSLKTGKNVYVVEINQLGRGAQEGGVK